MAQNGNGKFAKTVTDYASAQAIANEYGPPSESTALEKPDAKAVARQKKKESAGGGDVPSKLKLGLGGLGASATAQGINEGWSWLMRIVGTGNPESWWARNNDYLQASAPTMIGFFWYVAELFRLGNKPPSVFKLSRMEAANLAMNLGLSKFFQALRSRKQETKEALDGARAEAAKLMEDNKSLSEGFEKLKAKLAEAEKQIKQAEADKAKQGGGK